MSLSATFLRTRRKYRSDGLKQLLSEIGTKVLESDPVCALVRRSLLSRSTILDQSQLREHTSRQWDYDPSDSHHPFDSEPSIPRKRRLPISGSFANLDARPPTSPFVAELEDVTVLAPSGLAITADAQLVKDTVASDRSSVSRLEKVLARSIRHNGYRQTRDFVRSPTANCDRNVPLATTFVPVWPNYYHWTLECLPKLLGVETYAARTGDSPTVFLPPELPSWMRESLDLVAKNIHTEPLQPGTTHVDRFVVPSYPSPSRTECFWVRTRAYENADVTNIDPDEYPSRIYVTRQSATVRRIKNQEEVLTVLDKFDIQPYALETLSVREQVRLFANAELVVSPHGAGLTNLVYSSSPTVLELFGDKEKTTFYRLSKLMGFEYHAMFCGHDRKDLVVDSERLEHRIRSVIAGDRTPILEPRPT